MVVLEWVVSGLLQTPRRDGPTAKGSFHFFFLSLFFLLFFLFLQLLFKRIEPETIYKWTGRVGLTSKLGDEQ